MPEMAQNKTGTYVHVHSEGGQSTAVAPGDDFPDWYDADKSLTTAPDEEDSDQEVPGPGQFGGRFAPPPASDAGAAFKGWKVPELRKALEDKGVAVDPDARRDPLVLAAVQADVDPAQKPEV